MPKRKAINEIAENASSKGSAPPSKKSKKQKLLEARERARLWAKEQEEKNSVEDTIQSSPPTKRTSSQKKNPSKLTPPKRTTPKRTTPKRTTPRKIKDSTLLTSQEPKSERTNLPTKTENVDVKKPAKGKSKVAAAREKARLWAKQQEDQKKKSPSPKPKIVYPKTRPLARLINNSEQEEYHTTDEEDDSVEESSHVEPTPLNRFENKTRKNLKRPEIQIQQGVKLNKQNAQPNPFDQFEKYNGKSQKNHNNLKSKIPRIAGSYVKNVDTKMNIRKEQQTGAHNNTYSRPISQQSVVHSNSNVQPSPQPTKQKFSFFGSPFSHGSVQGAQEEADEDRNEHQTSRTAKYLKIFSFGTGVAVLVLLLQNSMPGEVKLTLPFKVANFFPVKLPKMFWRKSVTIHPCFSDNYDLSEGELDLVSPRKCDKTLESIPCPDGGRCSNGILHSCYDKDKVLASDGSRCVWSEETNESFAHIEAMLTNWTTKNFCEMKGNKFAHKADSKAPVFPFSMVANTTNIKKEMLLDSSNFVFSEIDNKDMIGLSDNYVDKKLVLPTTCWIGLATFQFLQLLGSVTLQTSLRSASWILQLVYAYPIISLLSFAILLTVTSIYRHRKRQKKLADDVVEVRELAYNRMMLENSEHVVLHLRDGIAMDLYPKSRKGRAYIITKVWPRVVADVRQDNRVLKTTQRVGMKRRDVWQWIAFSQSPRK